MNPGFSILEITVGIYGNCVVIISDAIHDLVDSISLGSARSLESKSKQEVDSKIYFGLSSCSFHKANTYLFD